MASVNQCNFVGNAGQDAEMSYTNTGTAVTRFSLAVNDYVGKDAQNNPKYVTTWLTVITWGNLAEVASKLVTKGGQYFVSGRLSVRNYTDRNNTPRTAIEIIANTVTPIGAKPSTNGVAKTPVSVSAGGHVSTGDLLGDLDLDDHPF